jgi:type II restriction/modification system DNA methylase subunit YeeA
VLDPACGSGNFLYLSLRALREVEKHARVEAAEMGLQADLAMHTGPHNILGLEINEFAAELARVTVWIGDIQWSRQNGYPPAVNPILRPLDGIEHRDALLNTDGSEAEWPEADVIVGNPPFLGGKYLRIELGDAYVNALNDIYKSRVPASADLVTYWFEKARAQIESGKLQATGLVATNSIRQIQSRPVLERIGTTSRIFEAWSDEPWVNEGAAVRVSLVGFGEHDGARLNGETVIAVHADLTAGDALDLTKAKRLSENLDLSFIGTQKNGPFDVPGDIARAWLTQPNPNGNSNHLVVRPWANGMDLTRRPSDTWIVDFGVNMPESEAALFEVPYEFALKNINPVRQKASVEKTRRIWWLHERTRGELRRAVENINRFIVTARVAKHRLFVWIKTPVVCDCQVVVIARDDDTTFGILHSRFHELWSLQVCTWMGVGNDPRYTPTTCFETFPFPAGFTPRDSAQDAAIAAAAVKLNDLRNAWLNPPEWVDWVITPEEEKANFPARPVAKPGFEAELKKRTLTNLYNTRPTWLDMAHKALDKAVATAYGWEDYTPETTDDEILRRLLALNLERS